MEKIIEHTYGPHIYMKLQLDNGYIAEVDEYIRSDGKTHILTTADDNETLRNQVIAAFNKLY